MQQTAIQILTESFNGALGRVVGFIPNVLGALSVLALGWMVARVTSIVITKVLSTFDFDELVERKELLLPLRLLGVRSQASVLAAKTVYWVLIILFLVPAAEALQMTTVSALISQLVVYSPRFLAGILLLIIGLAAARAVAIAVEHASREADLEYASALGRMVRYFVSFVIVVLALAQTGVRTDILVNIFIVLIVSFGVALALSLGLGSRSVVNNLLAGAFARELFSEGQSVEVLGRTGKIVSISSVGTTLETDGRNITVPNTLLIENIVE